MHAQPFYLEDKIQSLYKWSIKSIDILFKYIQFVINRIQNKSFCLHNICLYTVYIYYVYINTNNYVYI